MIWIPTALESSHAATRTDSAIGAPASAERPRPRSRSVAGRPALGWLQRQGAGPPNHKPGASGSRGHVTTSAPYIGDSSCPLAVVRSCQASGPLQEAELDRCAQSVRYDKTILIGNGHTCMSAAACRDCQVRCLGAGPGAAGMPPDALAAAGDLARWVGQWPAPRLPAHPVATVPLAAQPGDAGRTCLRLVRPARADRWGCAAQMSGGVRRRPAKVIR